jgi:hypothetical protein
MAIDITDFYIKDKKDPNFVDTQIEASSFIDTVISKIYMILLTNKGDILGNPNFGADIPKYLWKTKFSSSTITNNIKDQFSLYIPELASSDYKISVVILPGTSGQDIGVISVDLFIDKINVLFR